MSKKPKEVVFNIDTGDGIVIYIQGNENSVKIDNSSVVCVGDYGDDYKVLCTRNYFMDLFLISERTMERYTARGIVRPEPEKQGRRTTYDLFFNGFRISEYLDEKSHGRRQYNAVIDNKDDVGERSADDALLETMMMTDLLGYTESLK